MVLSLDETIGETHFWLNRLEIWAFWKGFKNSVLVDEPKFKSVQI